MTAALSSTLAATLAPPALDGAALLARLARTPTTVLRASARDWDGVALAALGAHWRRVIGDAGISAGERVVLSALHEPAFIGALLGALTHGATVALARPDDDLDALVETLDARLAIGPAAPHAARVGVAADGSALPRLPVARIARGPRTPGVALLLATSGSSGTARWIGLAPGNVDAVLASHAHALAPPASIVASVLPWHHCFGLILELVPALAWGAMLARDNAAGRDGDALGRLLRGARATHLHAVPATLSRALDAPGGAASLAALEGGVVGGAPVSAALAGALGATRLRAGYGLTEAAPGIALGAPGEWSARYLGRATGCETRIDADDVLAFRGPNAAVGEWRDDALLAHGADAWRRTDDVVRAHGAQLFHEARASATFKLANGRWVEAYRVEAALRARVAALHEVQLDTVDGHGLLLLHSTEGELAAAAVREALGALAALPLELRAVARDAWPRTPKGEVDRRAASSALAR
jgi:acyl-CoA synthetase (AMP-forming)/AMP-acid ligase II